MTRRIALAVLLLVAATAVQAQYPIGPPIGANPPEPYPIPPPVGGVPNSLYPPGEPGKRYVTAKLDQIRAVVLSERSESSSSSSPSRWSSSPASSYTPSSAASSYSPRFASLAERVGADPMIRHGSCPSGCQPAPRSTKEVNGEALSPSAANTADSHGASHSLNNQPASSSQRDDSAGMQAKDGTDTAAAVVRRSGAGPRCPVGCMIAPDFL